MALEPLGADGSPRIVRCLTALEVHPSERALSALSRMLDKVVEWNHKLDLTAARSSDELVDLFVADAAVVARLHPGDAGETWVDVGSGAGAPGVPLAILGGSSFTLVEPMSKRVAFLRTLVGALELERVKVRRDRAAELEDASFDVAISRATLEPTEWLRQAARVARKSIWLLVARGEEPPPEGFLIDLDESYSLPLTGAPRRALRYVRQP